MSAGMPWPVSDTLRPRVFSGMIADRQPRAASRRFDDAHVDGRRAAVRHRIAGVDDEVQHDLIERALVGAHRECPAEPTVTRIAILSSTRRRSIGLHVR